jgi:ABC-type transport system substrate-binding protein
VVIVPGGGAVWVANANAGTVTRIDPVTDRTQSFHVGHRPRGLAVVDNRVLVSLGLSAEDARSRIVGSRVLRAAVLGDRVPTTDSGSSTDYIDVLAVRYATGAGLMAYSVGASGLATVVPEIAAAPPTVSPDGLTYTFTVRKGFRFSPPSTEAVTAESLRYSIEWARKQDDYCRYIFSVIRKIETAGNRIVFTLDRPTGDLSARVAHPCATVVPPGTPIVPRGLTQPLPSAGPYYPDTHVSGQQIVLLRNPNYGGKRQHLDAIVLKAAIVLKLGYSSDEAAQLVERGDADFLIGEIPPTGVVAPDGPLARKYGHAAGSRSSSEWIRRPCRSPAIRRRGSTSCPWAG